MFSPEKGWPVMENGENGGNMNKIKVAGMRKWKEP